MKSSYLLIDKKTKKLKPGFHKSWLTVIRFHHYDKGRRRHYLCRCKCGKTTITEGYSLKNGKIKSCGCFLKVQMHKKFFGKPNYKARKDLTGQVFSKLTAIKFVKMSKNNGALWLLRCTCGKFVKRYGSQVKAEDKLGTVVSCGCLRGLKHRLSEKICRKHGIELKRVNSQKIKRKKIPGFLTCYLCRRERYERKRPINYNIFPIETKFNKWKITGEIVKDREVYKYPVICECGNTGLVGVDDLKSGHSKSCGCYMKEAMAKFKGIRRGRGNIKIDPPLCSKHNILKARRENKISKTTGLPTMSPWYCRECEREKALRYLYKNKDKIYEAKKEWRNLKNLEEVEFLNNLVNNAIKKIKY